MLNKIKAFVNQVVELVQAHKTLRSSAITATELVEDVYVFVSDEHCLCSAYLTKDVVGAFAATNSFGVPIIVINNKCNDLPLAYRDAIIHHELGHIKLGHLDGRRYLRYVNVISKKSLKQICILNKKDTQCSKPYE